MSLRVEVGRCAPSLSLELRDVAASKPPVQGEHSAVPVYHERRMLIGGDDYSQRTLVLLGRSISASSSETCLCRLMHGSMPSVPGVRISWLSSSN